MIQRIQSLLLLIGAVCFVAACFVPVGTIVTDDAYYVVNSWVAKVNIPDGKSVHQTYFIGILQVFLAGLSLLTLFFYKKRPLQSKLCLVGMLINFALWVVMLWVYPDSVLLPKLGGTQLSYSPWVLLSIVPLVCFYFANKFIVKDEKKVRAADRLR